jgi:hypothetical protein
MRRVLCTFQVIIFVLQTWENQEYLQLRYRLSILMDKKKLGIIKNFIKYQYQSKMYLLCTVYC